MSRIRVQLYKSQPLHGICRFTLMCACQVASLLILEGNKRFHYPILGVECNKRFTRILQCTKRFFRLFGETKFSPGFGIHQDFTRFCKFTRFPSGFGNNPVFTKFLEIHQIFHQVLEIHQVFEMHQIFTKFWKFTRFSPSFHQVLEFHQIQPKFHRKTHKIHKKKRKTASFLVKFGGAKRFFVFVW